MPIRPYRRVGRCSRLAPLPLSVSGSLCRGLGSGFLPPLYGSCRSHCRKLAAVPPQRSHAKQTYRSEATRAPVGPAASGGKIGVINLTQTAETLSAPIGIIVVAVGHVPDLHPQRVPPAFGWRRQDDRLS